MRSPILLCCGLLTLLCGCSSPTIKPGAINDRIGDEVRQAATERKVRESSAEKSLMPPLAMELPGGVEAVEPRFDLSVVNAPATQVFMALVNGTRYNMLIGQEVAGNLTINLKDVTVKEALESIRELYGYEYQIKGNRIVIQPNTLQTRMFQVNYLASRRQGATELRVTSGSIVGSGASSGSTSTPSSGATPTPQGTGTSSGTGSNLTSQVRTNTDADFWHDMQTALATIVGSADGRSVVINPLSGVIVIRALPRELRSVEAYLKATQAVVERQVMLEAKIIEVSLSQGFQSGINWGSFNGSSNRISAGSMESSTVLRTQNTGALTNTPTGVVSSASKNEELFGNNVTAIPGAAGMLATSLGKGFFGLALQTANFAALLNFLETQGSVSVLSSPRIATINNQKAVLKVGTDQLFVTNVTTNTTSTTTGSVSTPSLTLQPYFSGISLDVTPQVDDDNNIILHVHPAISNVTEVQKVIDLGTVLGTYKLPLASSTVNETDSIVRVQGGNIVAIGGLMKQDQSLDRSGLPGTSSNLTGTKSASMNKQELVILLKATVISDDTAWVKDLEQTSERLRNMDPRDLPNLRP
ncbi:MAG TPA: secretin N-terminal domain-containing protein [Rhodocyclaceae bacterium]